MNSTPKYKILEIRPDTIQCVRKIYNLDKPGAMEEAVKILDEWVQKQPHFNKKDFGDQYLERAIISCKGSIEKAKSRLDKICTMRTLMPQLFGRFNCTTDFDHLHSVVNTVMLPKLTDDHYRVQICKHFEVDWEDSQTINFYRHLLLIAEYFTSHDYVCGIIVILDYSEVNLMNILKKANPVLLKQTLTILIEGYGIRLKGIHIISGSKLVDAMVTLLKQVLSAKVASRITVHQSFEDLYEFIPKDILPVDYGGKERSIKTLQEEWIEVLSSEEHLNYLEEINKATTNESYRTKDKFFEQYGGLPGTFRFLKVD